jgi:hypothetical protein
MMPFAFASLGGASVISGGTRAAVATGYGLIQPALNNPAPAGIAIFGYRQNNVLVSETGVPASIPIVSGRVYAEISTSLNTGLAVANPSGAQAMIRFSFTDATGQDAGSGTVTLAPNSQLSAFLDQPPFNRSGPFQGTFSFTSSVAVGIIAIRGLTNERNDFLMSTIPVSPTNSAPSGTQVVPHFADGAGWTTQIVLLNPTDNPLSGTLQFANTDGSASTVTVAGQSGNNFSYSIAPRSSQKISTGGTGSTTTTGSVRVAPLGTVAPVPFVIFSYRSGGITISEAGVPVTTGTVSRMYVESSGSPGKPGSIQSGFAIANGSASSTNVTLELTGLDGVSVLPAVVMTLNGSGQTSKLLTDVFPNLPNPFKGVLRITTGAPSSAVGLRLHYNERGDFLITTTPPSAETSVVTSTQMIFPHIADGGGFTTQFILYSTTAGQGASGNLQFYTPAGQPLVLSPQ